MQKRQRERRCFAGAGLGTAHEITSGKYDGDGLRLDRRRLRVTLVGNGFQEFWREAEFIKPHRERL